MGRRLRFVIVTLPQKHEESCLSGTLVLQGVVTYMSHVAVFATRIKSEPSNPSSFSGADQGMNQECMAAI